MMLYMKLQYNSLDNFNVLMREMRIGFLWYSAFEKR